MLQEPRNTGVTRFVNGNGALFRLGHDLRLFFQTTDDAVNGVEEVLL